jgi:hypothetical protein
MNMIIEFFRKIVRVQNFASLWATCIILCAPAVLLAQNGVAVSNLVVDAGTVTFTVSWKNTGMPAVWSDSVWVFVDYNHNGTMAHLPLLPGATLTATSAPGVGTVVEEPGNNNGVWVIGNARSAGSFSATVKLLTATATATGACAYASNYPPVATYTDVDAMVFEGTPQYVVVLNNASNTPATLTGVTSPYAIPSGSYVQSFTDKTGAPGTIKCMLPATYTLSGANICLGSAVALTMNGSVPGWRYQLYRGSTAISGAAVTGTGSALTFNDTPVVAGGFSYTVRTEVPGATNCVLPASEERGITVSTLPAAPTLSGASRCGTGTLNLNATPLSGVVIDWYANAAGGAVLGGGNATNSFTTPSINTSTTYYAQARIAATGCVSASRTAVLATVNTVPANPTGTAGSRCGTGAVNLSASSSGAVIDWYSAASGGTSLKSANNNYTTPSISATTNYYAQARIAATGCLSAARTAVQAKVNTVPANPTGTAGSRCGTGTVNISAASSGAVIDWYSAASGGTSLKSANNNYTTPSISATTNYYAQARIAATGCLSASRTAVAARVNAVPTITRSGGAASQSVKQGTAITTITYTGNNATSMARSGSIPAGVTGTASGAKYTISGTPSTTGTFNYSVTASHTNGCTSAATQGTISVSASCTNCATWTKCSGFTLITSIKSETAMVDYKGAKAACTNKGSGWHIPTIEQARCICNNKSDAPGSFNIGFYWSVISDVEYGLALNVKTCEFEMTNAQEKHYVKCVK